MQKHKVGVIGLGAIGERLIKGISQHESLEVVAVCDTAKERVEKVANELGDIQWFTSHLTMLEEAKVDLVYVAVPPKFHHKITLDVVDKGIHVLCEKPLANSVEEAHEMMQKAEEAKVVHAMNFPLNYSPGANTFAKLVKENYVGKIRRVELNMHFPTWPRFWQQNDWIAGREQGGFVLEVGVHYIQLTQKIFGPLKHATSSLELPEDPTKCETGIFASLTLEDGTPFVMNGLSQIPGQERIAYTVYGSEGTLSLINWSELEGGKLGEDILPIPADETLSSSLLNHLSLALNGKESELYSFVDGYHAQVILEKLRESK
ncbi:Gfo/Idh/MocA family oxidoreductase [Bacillus timonensis]|nr:Gfo/Idh/MocA family oxidoreductase [Bacillus timonensis]